MWVRKSPIRFRKGRVKLFALSKRTLPEGGAKKRDRGAEDHGVELWTTGESYGTSGGLSNGIPGPNGRRQCKNPGPAGRSGARASGKAGIHRGGRPRTMSWKRTRKAFSDLPDCRYLPRSRITYSRSAK